MSRTNRVVPTAKATLLFLIAVASTSIAADKSSEDVIDVNTLGCIRDMTPVREFFVANFKGDLEATLAVANSETGGVYPAGSIVQLVPGEVMVKYDEGFSPATKDWEFIELDVTAEETKVRARGFANVVNRFGGNCFACHIQARPEWDLICEKDHGCDPIPLTADMIKGIQNTDPRCEPMSLPPEQIEALKQLQASMQQADK